MTTTPRRYPRRATEAGELFPALVEVLLHGWAAPYDHQPGDDPFRIFEYHDPELAHAWRTHEPEIRAEARRRGLARIWIEDQIAELAHWEEEIRDDA